MRRVVALAIGAGLAASSATAGAALATGFHFASDRGGLNHMAYMWRGSLGDADTTSSGTWTRFPLIPAGLHHPVPANITIWAAGPLTATLSVNLTGGPAAFRVVEDGQVLRPGAAHFAGQHGDTSRTFTFVANPGVDTACHRMHVEWRAPSQQASTVTSAAFVVDFDRPTKGSC